MHRGSLRNDLFLLAHDDRGRLLIPEATIGAGLAGATLIDLLLGQRVVVADGRLDVIDRSSTGDEETDATIEAIHANTAPCGPRAWVSWISHGAYGRVADLLDAAGLVRRTTVRRLGLVPVTRCLPSHDEDLVRVRARVRFAIHGRDLPDAPTAAMCGLVRVLRLESSLLLSMPTSDMRLALERMTAANEMTVRQVTTAVETVVTAATFRNPPPCRGQAWGPGGALLEPGVQEGDLLGSGVQEAAPPGSGVQEGALLEVRGSRRVPLLEPGGAGWVNPGAEGFGRAAGPVRAMTRACSSLASRADATRPRRHGDPSA